MRPAKPRAQPKPTNLRLSLDGDDLAHVKACARQMLLEPDRMHPPTKPAVVKWALAKAAEVAEG